MGWIFRNARYYLPNGKIDRKAECRELFRNGYTVLKDSIVGNTWYAAVREEKSGDVFAAVVLTKDGDRDYNFGYKDMDETVGPVECDCPKSILRDRINYNGKETEVIKMPPIEGICYRAGMSFKYPWYEIPATKTYIHKRDLPNDFEVIGMVTKEV